MSMNRGHGQPWEIRLGAVQAVIWIGLAVGSMTGAYFIGFFSGRYVGYETARSASAVEVAKLAVSDRLLDAPADEASSIYDRLNEPAVLDDSKSLAAKAGVRDRASSKDKKEDSTAVKIAQEIRSGVPALAGVEPMPTASDVESLFEEPGTPIESTDSLLAAAADADLSNQQKVRVLGGGAGAQGSDRAIGQILEERLAAARANQEKQKPVKEATADVIQKAVPAKAVENKVPVVDEPKSVEKSRESSSFARQVVPSGYFAQVAAPTKMSEADTIAKRLKRSGFPVIIETASVRGVSYYRVLVGPEQDKGTADRLVSQLQRERFLSGAPFIRRVK